jgi:DNA-binding response OmpR family regulator
MDTNDKTTPQPTPAASPAPAPAADPSARRILFIEDDQFIVDMYARGLRHAGYTVDVAGTGTKGLTMAQQGNYDLILLDIFLPEKSGIDILAELKGEGKPPIRSKIVIMTNYAHDDEERAALEAKADGYFIKADITPNKLVDLAQKLIG